MESSSPTAGRVSSGMSGRSRVENSCDLLMAIVCRQRFFPVFAKHFHYGGILNREEDRSFGRRPVYVLMIGPARNRKDVPLFPIEANASDDGGAPPFKDVIDGTVYLAMRFGVRSGPEQLNPGGDRIHHRSPGVRISVFQSHVIERAGIYFCEVRERSLRGGPLVGGHGRIFLDRLFPGGPKGSGAIFQDGAFANRGDVLA